MRALADVLQRKVTSVATFARGSNPMFQQELEFVAGPPPAYDQFRSQRQETAFDAYTLPRTNLYENPVPGVDNEYAPVIQRRAKPRGDGNNVYEYDGPRNSARDAVSDGQYEYASSNPPSTSGAHYALASSNTDGDDEENDNHYYSVANSGNNSSGVYYFASSDVPPARPAKSFKAPSDQHAYTLPVVEEEEEEMFGFNVNGSDYQIAAPRSQASTNVFYTPIDAAMGYVDVEEMPFEAVTGWDGVRGEATFESDYQGSFS